MNPIVLAPVISAVVTYMLTPWIRAAAARGGVVAHPGGRRVHLTATPLMGGIAIYCGFLAAVCVCVVVDPQLRFDSQTIGILVAATGLGVVGVLDDKYELSGWLQAAAILGSAGILAAFGVKILYVTNPFRGGHLMWLGVFSIPVTLIWVLAVTKALDCMDGLDGLAAGISAIAAATLMLMAKDAGAPFRITAVMAAGLLGSAIAFLRFNYPPAKIFMGTVGSQFLGFTLAAISIAGALKTATLVAVAVPVLILGVPLFDTTFVVLRRAVNGKRIDEADTTHLHHRLLNKGLSHRQVIWLIYALTAILCAAAYALFSYVK